MKTQILRYFAIVILLLTLLLDCSMKDPSKISLEGTWLFKVDSSDLGTNKKWFGVETDRSSWQRVDVPDYWDRYNLSGYDGIGWFAKSFEVKDSVREPVIFFAGVDDDAEVWLNGISVGSHEGYSEAFFLDIAKALRPGKNELVVKVRDLAGPGGIYKPVTVLPRSKVEDLFRSKYASLNSRQSEDWVRNAVIYEVFLRSFSKEGTFKALERRIPELKSLGVTVLWLMPIHPIGELNRKGTLGSPYSIEDFYGINSDLGTLEDLRSLVTTVHDHGLRIIIDLVANHTSWDSKLIQEHPEWFRKNEEGNIVSPNVDWFDVAHLDYNNHELRKYMIEMMKYWVRDVGIDGYRCDVAEMVPTDFWQIARGELDKIKPVMMLAEGTYPEFHVKAFDLTYSWSFYDALSKVLRGSTPVSVFDDVLKNEGYQYPRGSLKMRFNMNHDKNFYDAPAIEKYGIAGAKVTVVLSFTFPGVPMFYNGDEIGNDRRLDHQEKVLIAWKDNKDFRKLYAGLALLRQTHPALREGKHVPLKNSEGNRVYSFARKLESEDVVVVLNLSNLRKVVEIDVGGLELEQSLEYFTSGKPTLANGKLKLTLKPFDYRVFVKQ
ncbi:MAG: alpha-glucosidase C-terminal domain-containing protein [Ignavibacteriales bacterium]|nr:alpha-glucosidase C-terminal domain-containing protein [Ignavibacteriales bacterium]